ALQAGAILAGRAMTAEEEEDHVVLARLERQLVEGLEDVCPRRLLVGQHHDVVGRKVAISGVDQQRPEVARILGREAQLGNLGVGKLADADQQCVFAAHHTRQRRGRNGYAAAFELRDAIEQSAVTVDAGALRVPQRLRAAVRVLPSVAQGRTEIASHAQPPENGGVGYRSVFPGPLHLLDDGASLVAGWRLRPGRKSAERGGEKKPEHARRSPASHRYPPTRAAKPVVCRREPSPGSVLNS